MSSHNHFSIRERLEAAERSLDPLASRSSEAKRARREKKSPVRTEFQRDRDRIIHSKSFRRLKHKTQVFIAPEGDHYRTRLTHTLEVSQIARTISRALQLNDDLTEAIALGHDLGHTPFGHIGEKILDQIAPDGFKHYEQSLRVVDLLEYDGRGLNLTNPVRDGIAKHSKGLGDIIPEEKSFLPETLEGQIVRISDIIAYVNHDLDDALRAGIISPGDIPLSTRKVLGNTFAKRIDTIVIDVITESLKHHMKTILLSGTVSQEILNLRSFLFEKVYWRKESLKDRERIGEILKKIYRFLKKNSPAYINSYPESDSIEMRIMDFIAGMTDNYALTLYKKIQ